MPLRRPHLGDGVRQQPFAEAAPLRLWSDGDGEQVRKVRLRAGRVVVKADHCEADASAVFISDVSEHAFVAQPFG
jgi:hypothetical protein